MRKPSHWGSVSGMPVEIDGGDDGGYWCSVGNRAVVMVCAAV
jgi:hypothetical protein